MNHRALVFAAVVCCALPALGQTPSPPSSVLDQAKHYFDEGTKAYNLGEFLLAAAQYRLAYKVKADPVFLYNIAQAYRLAGDLDQALFFYRSFFRNAPATPNRREVENRIRILEEQVAKRQVVSSPPNATVSPGRLPPASEPPSAIAPASEPRPAETAARTGASEPAPTTQALIATGEPAPARKKPIYKKWWLWTTVGAAVAVGLGVGLGIGLSGSSAPESQLGTNKIF